MSDFPIRYEHRITVRALLLGDRIDTAGLERNDLLSTMPLAFRAGAKGTVALFRYGVGVMVGMSPLEEDEVIRRLDRTMTNYRVPLVRPPSDQELLATTELHGGHH